MAQSSWASGLQVSRWAAKLWYEVQKEIYFAKFTGDDATAMIQHKHELDAKNGKDVTIGLLINPSGSGVSGDDVLEGNEEALQSFSQTVTLTRKRNAFRNTGKFEEKKVLFDFRKEALASLKIWLSEKMDTDAFTAMSASPTRTFRADSGGVAVYTRLNQASITDELEVTDLIEPADISVLKKAAKIPKGSDELKIRPVRVNGIEYYILLVHPEQAYDLRENSVWQQAQREANIRGDENPIFNGMMGIYDNVVVHEHENITTSNTYNTSIHGAQAMFLGAQAGIYITGGGPEWVEKSFDYGNQLGVAGGMMYAYAKALYNSEDFATIAYYTASTRMT